MAPTAPPESEENPYELLGLSQEATDAEIRTAYRTRSLKVHPDRNRNDPHAAQKFHALTVASTLLLDPLRRLALDARLRLAAAKKARFAAYDNKRKVLVTELEERERAFKKSRLEEQKQKAAREGENDRIKEAGRRMREEREKQLEEQSRAKVEETRAEGEDVLDENAPPPMGPYDTTVRVKFTLSMFPSLGEAYALASYLKRFGEVDEGAVVLSIKPKKPSKKKSSMDEVTSGEGDKIVNAVVPFTQIGSAFAVISSAPTLKEQGIEVSWVGGTEPPILGWLRDKGELGGKPKGSTFFTASLDADQRRDGRTDDPQSTKFSTFVSLFLENDPDVNRVSLDQPSTFPTTPPPEPAKSSSAMDFESMTFLRLREAERARLEREILEAEARGDA